MSFERLGSLLPDEWQRSTAHKTLSEWREILPQLQGLDLSEDAVRRAEPLLVHLRRQSEICGHCQGYANCGKTGDERGMADQVQEYGGELVVQTSYCEPFQKHQEQARFQHYQVYSSQSPYERTLTFANFPAQQRQSRPQLFQVARQLSDQYEPGAESKGLYIFGPAGTGKTHLLQAMVHRFEERQVPCIMIRAEALFDRLRNMIGEGAEIEPVLHAFSTVPVLAIDEIGQERANEFTLEKLFRIINQRFSARVPTLFASNYAPPELYSRLPVDLLSIIDPLKSRLIGMSRVGDLSGDDHRLATMDLLDTDRRRHT